MYVVSIIADIHKDLEEGAIRLIAEHRDCLFAEAVRICKDPTTAEDLVSRTFAKAIQNIDSHDENCSLAAWLKTIMLNLYRNDTKRPVVRGTEPIDPAELERMNLADWSSEEQLFKNSDSEALREAIGRLDPKFKQVLVMHYFSELPVKAIASALGMPVGTVLWRLSIARKILAKDLAAKLGKKPLALLAVLLLGAATLFGAWEAGLGEWVEEQFSDAPTEQSSEAQQPADTRQSEDPQQSEEPRQAEETRQPEETRHSCRVSQNDSTAISTTKEQPAMKAISPVKSLKKTVLAATMLATTAFTASAEVGENLIQNGSFEVGMAGVDYGQNIQMPNFTLPTGWSASSWGGAWGIRGTENDRKGGGDKLGLSGDATVFDGYNCMAINYDGWISTQVEVLEPGLYNLKFHKVLRPYDDGTPANCYVDDALAFSISVPNGKSKTTWDTQEESIRIAAGLHTIKFQGSQNRWDEGMIFDDISLCLVEADKKVSAHVTCPENVTYTATVNGVEIGEEAYVNQEVEVRATPVAGKVYASVPAGWTLHGTSIVKTFTVGDEGLEINIPEEGLVDVSAGFSKTFEITVSGYNGATLADFPALIRLSTSISKFSYDDFLLPNGGDLRFTTEDGVPLAHEIDTWNENGESLVWVKVPSLAKDVKIIAYYGNSTPWVVDTAAVWTDYAGVWHFAQFDTTDTTTRSQASSPNSTAEEGIDAHIADKEGTLTNQEGRFGTGVQTADASSKGAGLWMQDPGENSPLDGGAYFTISGWFKHHDADCSWDHIFYKRSRENNATDGSNPYNGGFAIEVATAGPTYPLTTQGNNGGWPHFDTTINARGKWVYLTFVYDGAKCTTYADGKSVLETKTDFGAASNNNAPLAVGNNSNFEFNGGVDSPWRGFVDEVRFSKGVKSAEWITAEYECAAGDILSMGEVQTIVSEDLVTVTITADDSKETYTATANDESVTSGGVVSSNAMVTVVATPKTDYLYFPVPEGWTKGTEEKTITAKFRAENDPTVIAIPDPTAIADIRVKVTVEPPQYGTITGAEDEYEYGAQATLTAEPEDGFVFAGWTGAAEGETANPLTVTMDDNKTIGAIFKPVNLVQNGSFEDCEDDIGPGKFKDDGNFTRPAGWEGGRVLIRGKESGAGDGTYVGDGTYITESEKLPDGEYCLGFKYSYSLSTSVTVKKSGRYILTIQKICRKNQSWYGDGIGVFFDDAKIAEISAPSNSNWEEQSFEVFLGPGEHTLKFTPPNSWDQSIFLDDISLILKEELPAEVVVDTEHVSQSFNYQNVGVERSINVKVEVPSAGYTIKYSTTEEGEYTTVPIKYWQAGEYTIYYRVEAAGMEPAAGFGTVTIGENWMPNGSFEDGTWISNNNYGILNNAIAGTEVWKNTKDSGKENGDICRAYGGSPFLGNVPAADGSYAYIATLDNQISAPINLARSGKYQFSCKYMCRVNYNTIYDQTAIVKIDGVAVATVPSTEEKTKWLDFSSEKFQLKKGKHEITIEGTTSQDSTILLDALRLDFKGSNGLIIYIE